MIPANSPYNFINALPFKPRHIEEALKLYGLKEAAGNADTPDIIAWDEEVGYKGIYSKDSTPWCGLFVAICLHRAGRKLLESSDKYSILRALKWAEWGVPVTPAMFGDLLVFQREGGGHVGFYVGEDDVCYHVLGGNQSDMVNVARIAKTRCVAICRPPYNNQPESVKRIWLDAKGTISTNEK